MVLRYITSTILELWPFKIINYGKNLYRDFPMTGVFVCDGIRTAIGRYGGGGESDMAMQKKLVEVFGL